MHSNGVVSRWRSNVVLKETQEVARNKIKVYFSLDNEGYLISTLEPNCAQRHKVREHPIGRTWQYKNS